MNKLKNKRNLLILLTVLLCCSFTGCGSGSNEVIVNVENEESIYSTTFGKNAMVYIGNKLYYDSTTRIVYWWNGKLVANNATTPSPYYAPNGLPYKYNPSTNTFEEIEHEVR